MPEATSTFPYVYTPDTPKKAAIIKVSCGIGDTDGFPAFDVDSDAYAAKDDPKWGFLITGGAEFHMPLTVFQVTPEGLADKGGIRLGDIILEINEDDATELTLTQAHEKIEASGKKIHFLVKNMEEDPDFELGEEKCIVLRVPKPAPPPKVKSAASIEARLREMQRKLSEIAEIPKILSSTLATVSQTFEKLNPSDFKQQQRKFSYDEDALDYELSGATTVAVTTNSEQRHKLKAKGKANAKATVTAACDSGGEKLYLVKDSTPESDYASEGNYESNEADTDDDDYVHDVGEGGKGDEYEEGNRKYKNCANTSVCMAAEFVGNDKEACFAYVTRMRPVKSAKQQQKERKQNQKPQYRDNVNASEELEDDLSTTEDDTKDYDVDEDEDEDEGEGESEDSDDDVVVTARLPVDDVSGSSNDDDETDYVDDDAAGNGNDDDDENDFLTATYTWNLSKIPKLRLNDKKQSDDESNSLKAQIDMDDTDEDNPNKKARWCHTDDDDSQQEKHLLCAEDADEKEQKFADKLERFWPWADREKIIYKQSTCHLVRRRPLGLVEQRIKLLAKQNLSDSLERQLKH